MVTGERLPEGSGAVGPEGCRRIFCGGDGVDEHGEDPLGMILILYLLQNKLSLVGGHYAALMVLRRRRKGAGKGNMTW